MLGATCILRVANPDAQGKSIKTLALAMSLWRGTLSSKKAFLQPFSSVLLLSAAIGAASIRQQNSRFVK